MANGEKRKTIKWAREKALPLIITLAVVVLAWTLARIFVGNELLVPDFSACVKEVFRLLGKGEFWTSFSSTLFRIFCAFCLSFCLALVAAVLSYVKQGWRKFLTPIVSFLRSLPTLAIVLLLLVWYGAGVAPVMVAFLSLFPMLYTEILSAFLQTDEKLIEMSKVYRVPLKERILRLYIPSALPYVIRSSGAALSFSLKLVVSAEVLSGTYNSLGGMMQNAKLYMEIPLLFALIILTFLVGWGLENLGALVASFVQRRKR